jgi:hypothetical protein
MMKKIALIAALGLMGATSAMAQTVTGTFNVNVNLTSACRVSTGGTPSLDFGAYTAFQASPNMPTVGMSFECTRNLGAPNIQFDAPAWGTAALAGTTTSGEGVLAGLRYTMTVAAPTVNAGTAPNLLTPGNIGTPASYTYTISGNMAAGQAGSTPTGPQSHQRTLTISF